MKPKSPLQILIAVVVLMSICGLGTFLYIDYRLESNYLNTMCATAMVVPLQGIILDSETHQPIANAEVILRNLSAEQSRCQNIGYLSEERLTTDAEGVFRAYRTLHFYQSLEITISAQGCTTVHEQMSADWFSYPLQVPRDMYELFPITPTNIPYRMPEFTVECSRT